MSFQSRVSSWFARNVVDREEAERVAALNAAPPPNNAAVTRPVAVELLRAVRIEGAVRRAGERVVLPWHLARDLVHLKRARWAE